MTGYTISELSPQNADSRPDGEPDLQSLRSRYRAERDRRLEGRAQAPELVGSLANYLDDPHNEPQSRPRVIDDVSVTIIGAGFGGLLAGAALRENGVDSIRLIDKAGGVGGTWYWNRYPGIRCDIESYIYMPLLEELSYIPSERYASGAEILRHAENIAARYNLTDKALFHTSVASVTWGEEAHLWTITTDRGDEFRSRFVIGAIGFLSNPKLSAISGLETFRGRSFHTSRWDYSYTGENLEKLADKVVGVVGTGSSAIQVIPHIAASAKHLFVFQRTPAAVGQRDNRQTDLAWARSLTPGWQRLRMENFTAMTMGEGASTDMVQDGFSEVFQSALYRPRAEAVAAKLSPEEVKAAIELADVRTMDKVRQRVAATVRDPDTAEALMPYFYYLCKRPCFHDEYLDAFNKPNVTLVPSPRGVEEIRAGGVVAGKREYELDLLVYSTGFETSWENGPTYCKRGGFEIYGTGRRPLTEKWQAGTRTFHGIMTAGFPNLFFMPSGIATSVRTPNHMHTLTENSQHIAYIVREVLASGAVTCEPDPEREADWVRYVVDQSTDARAFWESCTPGRFNGEGEIVALRRQDTAFVERPLEFFRRLAEWRSDGKLEGLSLQV